MNFLQKIKKSLSVGKPEEAIDELLSNSVELGKENHMDVILLSGQLQKWNADHRLGLAPPKSDWNRISLAILEIVDRVDSENDLLIKDPIKEIKYQCLYDTAKETGNNDKKPWTLYNSAGFKGNYHNSILIENSSSEGKIFTIKAFNEEFVGIQKPINRLSGYVELEYMAINSSNPQAENLLFIMIPMKHNYFDQTGYIEVGSDFQDDPQNPFSPFRKRFIVPRRHIENQRWHKIILEFDFRYIEEAFYTIFAPRINEGLLVKSGGEIKFKNLKIYG